MNTETTKNLTVCRAMLMAIALVVVGCTEKQSRIWIDPPVGYLDESRSPKKLFYQSEDVQSGRKSTVAIPIDQVPRNLVVENRRDARGAEKGFEDMDSATKADKWFAEKKVPSAEPKGPPSVSYLKGLQEVETLYSARRFNEALIKISPLLEQYPKQPRLFAMQGTLYRKIGEKKMAVISYRRALELDKNNPQIEEALSRVADEAGEDL